MRMVSTNDSPYLQRFKGRDPRTWYREMEVSAGVQFFAERWRAWWLLEIIFKRRIFQPAAGAGFQVWELERNGYKDTAFTLRVNSQPVEEATNIVPQGGYPEDRVKLWLIEGVLMLPTEY